MTAAAPTRRERAHHLRLALVAQQKARAYWLFAHAHLALARSTAAQLGPDDAKRHVAHNVRDAANYRRLAKEHRAIAYARFCQGMGESAIASVVDAPAVSSAARAR